MSLISISPDLMWEYLRECDSVDKDEWYGTDRNIKRQVFEGFLEWVTARQGCEYPTTPYDVSQEKEERDEEIRAKERMERARFRLRSMATWED